MAITVGGLAFGAGAAEIERRRSRITDRPTARRRVDRDDRPALRHRSSVIDLRSGIRLRYQRQVWWAQHENLSQCDVQ